ncbi:methylated-DNA--protein-cysteine methyltransferase [Aliidongia dinghuensis]|uniref:Methylated-DNA--protein-cysteine methyltransferase n=1 Tax=Aliidongia dinghuensis TaxID=1867774 RepID=A0A8J2YXB7_9PROT|nr:methylated-DNA--protein-cysteine methyltransferase [Aliidongia dinghuensis]
MMDWSFAPEAPAEAEALSVTVSSPLGPLTVTEVAGAIVRLRWRGRGGSMPPATTPPTPLLAEAARQLAAYFDKRLKDFDLPLRPDGSPFQQAVWGAMCRIPAGATRTYGSVAAELDVPARAVGGACGTNPIPIIIPCHRILAAGGSLGGYSGQGGAETKLFLLALEGAEAPDADPRQMKLL